MYTFYEREYIFLEFLCLNLCFRKISFNLKNVNHIKSKTDVFFCYVTSKHIPFERFVQKYEFLKKIILFHKCSDYILGKLINLNNFNDINIKNYFVFIIM